MENRNYTAISSCIPACGVFAADDAATRKRKELAEKLKRGEKVKTTPSGEVVGANSSAAQGALNVPDGKLAAYTQWYERDHALFRDEKAAMARFFPDFKLDKLDDGRLCWVGNLAPCGADDIIWTVMAVYNHDHPNTSSAYGTSVRVYSINPDLDDIKDIVRLPHVLRDEQGSLFMCTNEAANRHGGLKVESAATTLAWAAKWTAAVTCWMHGDLPDEYMFVHGKI
jgi:hypothetical protein